MKFFADEANITDNKKYVDLAIVSKRVSDLMNNVDWQNATQFF